MGLEKYRDATLEDLVDPRRQTIKILRGNTRRHVSEVKTSKMEPMGAEKRQGLSRRDGLLGHWQANRLTETPNTRNPGATRPKSVE